MMKKLWSIVKWLLIVWGVLCVIGAMVLGGIIAYSLGPGNRDSIGSASKHDVRFVLNGCQLGDHRIDKVVHSYKSARSFTGDHLDAYAIKITHIDPSELIQDKFGSGWFRCDQTDGVLKDAIDFVCGWLHDGNISWFPKKEELKSSDMYIYPLSIHYLGTRPTAVKLIFIRPKDKMVFFISLKI